MTAAAAVDPRLLAIDVDPATRTIAGLDAAALAERFGSPFYLYDLDVVTRRIEALRAALPRRALLAYAMKSNPSRAVVGHMVRRGLRLDIASGGELQTALLSGIEPDRILFTGPAKTDAELEQALDARVGVLTIESPGELHRLIGLVRRRRTDGPDTPLTGTSTGSIATRPQPILLRLATGTAGAHRSGGFIVGEGSGKFGFVESELDEAAELAMAEPGLELIGLHAFGASNVRDADQIGAHVEWIAARAIALARQHRFRLRLVDCGGGLGIPYGDDESPLDLERLAEHLATITDAWELQPDLADARLLFEPGRFLVGPAGTYVSRVIDAKPRDGGVLALVDGGIHHLVRPALIREEMRIRLLQTGERPDPTAATSTGGPGEGNAPMPLLVTVGGPLCTGTDILARNAALPEPVVGDLVAIVDAGAYGFSESMPYFLSHPQPAEVVVRGGTAELARPRLDPIEWIERQVDPFAG